MIKKLSFIFIFIFLIAVSSGCDNGTADKAAVKLTDEQTAVTANGNNDTSDMDEVTDNVTTDIPENNSTDVDSAKTSDFIFPNSSNQKLTTDEVMQLDTSKLDLARNEIFARNGNIFDNEKYKNYFNTKTWYKPAKRITVDDLTAAEKYNVNLISYYEDSAKPVQNNYKQTYETHKAGEKVKVDLNGDGIAEEILYIKLDEGYKLIINNTAAEGDYMNLADSFAIVDIDKSDKYKEIIISDYGPSDDYTSKYYFYDGKNVIDMGMTGGLYDYRIMIDGSGRFAAMTRGRILQTWFFDKHYELTSEHKLAEIPEEVYSTDYNVFVKQKIKLYDDRKNPVSYFILDEGQAVKIKGTDNKEWCLVEARNGKNGWFRLRDFDVIADEGVNAQEIFAGLCYAD